MYTVIQIAHRQPGHDDCGLGETIKSQVGHHLRGVSRRRMQFEGVARRVVTGLGRHTHRVVSARDLGDHVDPVGAHCERVLDQSGDRRLGEITQFQHSPEEQVVVTSQ